MFWLKYINILGLPVSYLQKTGVVYQNIEQIYEEVLTLLFGVINQIHLRIYKFYKVVDLPFYQHLILQCTYSISSGEIYYKLKYIPQQKLASIMYKLNRNYLVILLK